MKKIFISIFTFLALVGAPITSSAQDVKIGVIYPLTGASAQIGKDAVAAVKTALDIINNKHNIPGMPLAKDAGLKGLNGAKVSIVVGDHTGKPDVGVSETEKMLNKDGVHAMYGAYYSSGSDSGMTQNAMAKEQGFDVVEKISYKAKTTSLSSEVQILKAKNPDVLLPSQYTADAFLFLNTAKELDYNPKMLIAQNSGYVDPTFISTMGNKAEGVISRSPFNTDLAKTIPMIGAVNEIFKKYSGGRDLSDVPARAFTGFMALAVAINNAGSTDPEQIRQALVELDIPAESLIVPYRGIKFGPDGQNAKVRGIMMQVQNGKYCTVYPYELAACDLVYPMPTWDQK